MKTYKVIGVKTDKIVDGVPFFDVIIDSNGVKWDANSHVTDSQVNDTLAAELIAKGELVVITEEEFKAAEHHA